MRKNDVKRETFRSHKAERHYENKRRDLEKQKRHHPIGRLDWMEE
jgi:hypothetical protein